MTFRQKSAERVVADLKGLLGPHPSRMVCMVDNIMPHGYFRTLLPRLADELPGLHVFYEQKANLSLDQVIALMDAGVKVIQPGIEALSTPLLKRMDKGVTARQNLALLRHARSVGLALNWNLLYAFPGDSAAEYRDMLDLFPLIRHLPPPTGTSRLSIDRFSPYFFDAERYGVANLRPMRSYAEVFPDHADRESLAYHFEADYASGCLEEPGLVAALNAEVESWIDAWARPDVAPPVLSLSRIGEDAFLLLDTRGLDGTRPIRFLDGSSAGLLLRGVPTSRRAEAAWAVEGKLLAPLDGWLEPLATGGVEVLREFEAPARRAVLPVVAI